MKKAISILIGIILLLICLMPTYTCEEKTNENEELIKNIQHHKILPSDGESNDDFGCSVSIDGDYAIIGSCLDDGQGTGSGSAYIFNRNGSNWTQQAKLLPSDGASSDWFGYSVSLDGNYAIIGSMFDDDQGSKSGSAYIFQRNGSNWTQQAKLLPSDGEAEDTFGRSVSIHGDYAIIGARTDDDQGTNSGSAYIFQRNGSNWTQQAKLLPSDGEAEDRFGISVSIHGDYAIIGSYQDDDHGIGSGSAYIFHRNGNNWIQQAKLLPSDGGPADNFGNSVSINGEYSLIGALNYGSAEGKAYIFHRNGSNWIQQDILLPSDGAQIDVFGCSVSIHDDYAIIGSMFDDDQGNDSGSAYIFHRNGNNWTQQAKLLPFDGSEGDMFGNYVSTDGDYILIGARRNDDQGENSGSAYMFNNININQHIQDRGFPIRQTTDGDWAGAQSFIPTTYKLTSAKIFIRKFGIPEFNLTVELRENNPQGTLIDTLTFIPEEVSSSWEWLNLNFIDTIITPEQEYFIICPPVIDEVTTSFGYEWGYAFGNIYPEGAFWFTRDGGGLWRDLPTMYDFCFKSFGYS